MNMEKIVEQVLREVKIGVDGDIKTVNFGSDSKKVLRKKL